MKRQESYKKNDNRRIFLVLWESCALVPAEWNWIEFKAEIKQRLRHKERQRCGKQRMHNIMESWPSISLPNLLLITVKIFPQQGNVNGWHHLSASHPLLARLLLSHPSFLIPSLLLFSPSYEPSLSPSTPFVSLSFPSFSTCASHCLLLLSLLKAKKVSSHHLITDALMENC